MQGGPRSKHPARNVAGTQSSPRRAGAVMTEDTSPNASRPRRRSVDSTKHGADSGATSPAYGDDMSATAGTGVHVVVVGAGMVAHRFAESLLSRADETWRLTLIGEE